MIRCQECPSKKFSSEEALRQHAKTIKSKFHPYCSICDRWFSQKDGYLMHKAAVHPPEFFCQSCKREYKSEAALEEHFRGSTAHPNCKKCKKGLADSRSLELHMRRVHPQIACTLCDGQLIYEDKLEEHYFFSRNHPKCSACGHGLKDDASYHKHLTSKHLELRCTLCGLQFVSKKELDTHYWLSRIHPKCQECNIGFPTYAALHEHETSLHNLRVPTPAPPSHKSSPSIHPPIRDSNPDILVLGGEDPAAPIMTKDDDILQDNLTMIECNNQMAAPTATLIPDVVPKKDAAVTAHIDLRLDGSGGEASQRNHVRSRSEESAHSRQEDDHSTSKQEPVSELPPANDAISDSRAPVHLDITSPVTSKYILEFMRQSLDQSIPSPNEGSTDSISSRSSSPIQSVKADALEETLSCSPPAPESPQLPAASLVEPITPSRFSGRDTGSPISVLSVLSSPLSIKAKSLEISSASTSGSPCLPSTHEVTPLPSLTVLPPSSPRFSQFRDFLDTPTSANPSSSSYYPDLFSPLTTVPRPAGLDSPLNNKLEGVPELVDEDQASVIEAPVSPISSGSSVVASSPPQSSLPSPESHLRYLLAEPVDGQIDRETHAQPEPAQEPPANPTLSQLHCRICRQDPCDNLTATMCGHIFCKSCITEAIIAAPRCPVCQTATLLYCLFRLDLSV